MFSGSRRNIVICLLLASITLALYWPVTNHDFVSYDDGIYIVDNPHVNSGFSSPNITWAFRTGYAGNWHPLTWVSHMVDVQWFGLHAGWHHFVSVLFHSANTVLLFLLLIGMTGATWRSAFVAALLGWHPQHVESVAWAAERKDVMSALFRLLTLLAYAKYARSVIGRDEEKSEDRSSKSEESSKRETPNPSVYYILALVFFALGLLSKPMLVTMPFVLLLLDIWPLQRVRGDECPGEKGIDAELWKFDVRRFFRLFVEKLPFFALTIASCVATFIAQKGGGAVVPLKVLTFTERLGNAIVAYVVYLAKMFWPANLGILYPLHADISLGLVTASAVALLLVTAWTLWRFRSSPHLAVGWLWYIGMLVPVIGLVQVGMQQMADRYTYLPFIGIFIMLAWEIPNWIGSIYRTRILAVSATLILLGCLFASNRQITFWQNSETLFGHAAQVTKNNYIAFSNHGQALFKQGRVEEAIAEYEKAIVLDSNLDAAHLGLGEALMQQGKFDNAIGQFTKVLELNPETPGLDCRLEFSGVARENMTRR